MEQRPGSEGYHRGSEGYHRGSEGYRRDSEGYHRGSEGASDGHQGQPDEPDPPAAEVAPWWRTLGFPSFEAYLGGLAANQEKLDAVLGDDRRRTPPAAGRLPRVDAAELPPPGSRADIHGHQVGIRLSDVDYAELVRVAASYRVAPSTMARMLVSRGVRATLDAGPAAD